MTPYFFVCGAPKSGTTWVQLLLDAHPEVTCSGEGHFIERLVVPLVTTQENYNKHLRLVAERVYQGRPYYELLTKEDVAELAREFVARLMEKRRKPTTKIIGDKTPRYTQSLNDLRHLFPQALFVHIVRDPRDVAVSLLHHGLRAGYSDALTPGSSSYRMLVSNSCGAWRKALEDTSRFAAQCRKQFFQVRYEDLQTRPEVVVGALLSFLGVDQSQSIVRKIIAASSFEQLSGRKPGEENKMSFFRKGIVGDWRNVLDDEAQAEMIKSCGAFMGRLGYRT